MLTKLKLVWNQIWSCHHEDNKVLDSIPCGTDANSFDQFGGRILLRLQRAAARSIVVKCWSHWCLQRRKFNHNDIDDESWAVDVGAATRRCTFSFQFSPQNKKSDRDWSSVCTLILRNDFLIKNLRLNDACLQWNNPCGKLWCQTFMRGVCAHLWGCVGELIGGHVITFILV